MILSLSKAIAESRLEDFIAQEESRGVEAIIETDFENTASIVIKTPPQGDQTLGSLHSDGSPET